MRASREEVISAFESILTEMSVVDLDTIPIEDMLQVSLSEDLGLHCGDDFQELSDDLELQGVEISADRLQELDLLGEIFKDLTSDRD